MYNILLDFFDNKNLSPLVTVGDGVVVIRGMGECL